MLFISTESPTDLHPNIKTDNLSLETGYLIKIR